MRQLAISWATEFLPRFVIGGAEKGDCGRCGAEIPRLGVDSMGGMCEGVRRSGLHR